MSLNTIEIDSLSRPDMYSVVYCEYDLDRMTQSRGSYTFGHMTGSNLIGAHVSTSLIEYTLAVL